MLPELLAVQLTKDQPENHKKQLRESYTPTVFFSSCSVPHFQSLEPTELLLV